MKQEPGSWMDEWGACKVCDGEIPYGHTPECAILKYENKVTALNQRIVEAEAIMKMSCYDVNQRQAFFEAQAAYFRKYA